MKVNLGLYRLNIFNIPSWVTCRHFHASFRNCWDFKLNNVSNSGSWCFRNFLNIFTKYLTCISNVNRWTFMDILFTFLYHIRHLPLGNVNAKKTWTPLINKLLSGKFLWSRNSWSVCGCRWFILALITNHAIVTFFSCQEKTFYHAPTALHLFH